MPVPWMVRDMDVKGVKTRVFHPFKGGHLGWLSSPVIGGSKRPGWLAWQVKKTWRNMKKQPGSPALADALVMINLLGTCGKKHEWCIFNMIFILRFSAPVKKEIELWKKKQSISISSSYQFINLFGFDDIRIYHQLLPSDILIIQMEVTELTPEKVSQSLPTGETNESPLKSDTCFVPISDGLSAFFCFVRKQISHGKPYILPEFHGSNGKMGCISNSIFQILNYFPLKHDYVKKSALPKTNSSPMEIPIRMFSW